MSDDPAFLLLAGEASGDQHAAGVAAALRERWPACRLVGLGGERMRARGVELLAELDDLAVMGFVEVLSRLPFFLRLERRLRAVLDEGEIDLVIPVDYPGLNLRLARAARERGIPVLYYIAPQVWAWRAGRAARLARDTDRVAVILPFEAPLLQGSGARATFVGHPLVEEPDAPLSRETFAALHGLDPERPILALFAGSRRQEVARHLDLFLAAGRRVQAQRPETQLALARADTIPAALLEGRDVAVVDDGRSLLRYARAALVKSGTTTLEAALAGTPFVTAYRTHPVTFMLARRLVRVPHIALANLVAGRRVAPELLQGEATPERLAELVLPLMDPGSARRREIVAGLARVREALGAPGAATRVAALAGEILAERHPVRWGGGEAQEGGRTTRDP